jgi:hypothetical protein
LLSSYFIKQINKLDKKERRAKIKEGNVKENYRFSFFKERNNIKRRISFTQLRDFYFVPKKRYFYFDSVKKNMTNIQVYI